MKKRKHIIFICGFIAILILVCRVISDRFSINRYPETADREEAYEVIIENLTLGQTMPDLHAVEEAVSAITLPALNCTVKIRNIPISSHVSTVRLMNTQNEQLDLINTGRTDALPSMVRDGLLLPLDDLLSQYGTALLSANESLIEGCRINGTIYAVPAAPYRTVSVGFVYNADLAEQLGINLSDHPSISQLEDFAVLLKTNGKYLFSPGDGLDISRMFWVLYPDLTSIGSTYFSGVLRETDDGLPVIENLYDTEEYLDYCLLIQRWWEKGWIPADSMTSGLLATDQFRQDKLLLSWSAVSPIELALQSREYPFQIGMITTGESAVDTNAVQENGWGISSTSRNPQKAMEFLNFVYENEEAANLLMNGLEGKEYQKVSDHIITFLDGQNANDLKYSRNFSMFGDYRKIYEWEPMTENDYESLQTYYQEEPSISPYLGYSFDLQPVSKEIAAVSDILSDYLPALECGVIEDVPGVLSILNEKLEQAGIDRIIAENQKQLDAWLTEHPVS